MINLTQQINNCVHFGKSTEGFPSEAEEGHSFFEIDTGYIYIYTAGFWQKINTDAGQIAAYVYLSITKSNIGTVYTPVYVNPFNPEELANISFLRVNKIRVIFSYDYNGIGMNQCRWVDRNNPTNVLIESPLFDTDQTPGIIDWTPVPPSWAGVGNRNIQWQIKSTVAGDDPVPKGYAIYTR